MFENVNDPLASTSMFVWRMIRYAFFSMIFIAIVLMIGTTGYYFFENMKLIDAFTNSALTLADMGLVTPIVTTSGKIFASFYALISGLLFFSIAGMLFAPIVHRFFHMFHLTPANKTTPENKT